MWLCWIQSLLLAAALGAGAVRGCAAVSPPAPDPALPVKPQPAPVPVPKLEPVSSLERTAKAYIQSFPHAMRTAAAGVRGKTLKSKNDVVAAIVEAHSKARTDWTSALDQAFAPLIDSAGKITSPEKAAAVLDLAASAMELP